MTEAIEAVKCALRQSKDGVVVSFVLHPNDDASHLLSMPIGQRVMLAVQPFTESGADTANAPASSIGGVPHPAKSAGPTSPTPSGHLPPVNPPQAPDGRQSSPGDGDAREAPPTLEQSIKQAKLENRVRTDENIARTAGIKPRVPFHQKPLSQQAGILCRDVAFQLWACAQFPRHQVAMDEPKSCEIWLKRKLGIVSFTELDDEGAHTEAAHQFVRLVEQFESDPNINRAPRATGT